MGYVQLSLCGDLEMHQVDGKYYVIDAGIIHLEIILINPSFNKNVARLFPPQAKFARKDWSPASM